MSSPSIFKVTLARNLAVTQKVDVACWQPGVKFCQNFLWTLLILKFHFMINPILMGEELDNDRSAEICTLCTSFLGGPVFKILFAKLLPHLQLAITIFYSGCEIHYPQTIYINSSWKFTVNAFVTGVLKGTAQRVRRLFSSLNYGFENTSFN